MLRRFSWDILVDISFSFFWGGDFTLERLCKWCSTIFLLDFSCTTSFYTIFVRQKIQKKLFFSKFFCKTSTRAVCSVFLVLLIVSKRWEQNPTINEEIFQNLSIFKIVFGKLKKLFCPFCEVTTCQHRGGTKRPKRFHSEIFPRGWNVTLWAHFLTLLTLKRQETGF